jgi:hypothetical protein
MIYKKKMPITGTNTAMKSKPPVKSSPFTSRDAQKQVNQPPQPFANPQGAMQTSTSSGPPGGVSTMEPKIASGLRHTNPGAKALPSGGAVGYKKLPNQSKQIGGRLGVKPTPRKAGNNTSGQPNNRNARFYGE